MSQLSGVVTHSRPDTPEEVSSAPLPYLCTHSVVPMKLRRHLTSTMKTHTIPAILVLALGTMFMSAKLQSQVIYSEYFLNTAPSGNMYLADFGWSGYIHSTAQTVTASNAYIPNLAGNPSPDKGYLTLSGLSTSYAMLETFSGIDAAGSEITWSMGNSATSTTVRLLVQSGSSWYASSEVFSNTTAYASQTAFSAATTSDVRRSLTFSTAADDWRSFTLNPGTAMTLGSVAGSDLSSLITGIGFYVTTTSGTTRLDSLVVTAAVPEPSSYAVLLGAVTLLAAGYGRKRSRFKQAA